MADALVNGSARGLGLAAAATSVGVIAAAASAASALPSLAEGISTAMVDIPNAANDLYFEVITNPRAIGVASDVVSELAGSPSVPEHLLSMAADAASAVADHWPGITGWISRW